MCTAQIGDAFEFPRDFHHRGDSPQIDGDRLMQGENLQAFVFDANVPGIDRLVAFLQGFRTVFGGFGQLVDGEMNHLLDLAAHRQNVAMNSFQVIEKVNCHGVSILTRQRDGMGGDGRSTQHRWLRTPLQSR